MTRNILLAFGIVSSIYYFAINIIVAAQYPGYDPVSQTVSELSAIDSPTRPLWMLLATFYSVFIILFAGGVWLAGNSKPRLRTMAVVLLVYGISGFFWPPMHQRAVLAAGGGTLTDTMHIAFAIFTVVLMMVMILLGSRSFGRSFMRYSIATIIMLLGFGFLTSLSSPHIAKNMDTPLVGIWERIDIGIFLIWIIAFAMMLVQSKRLPSSTFPKSIVHT